MIRGTGALDHGLHVAEEVVRAERGAGRERAQRAGQAAVGVRGREQRQLLEARLQARARHRRRWRRERRAQRRHVLLPRARGRPWRAGWLAVGGVLGLRARAVAIARPLARVLAESAALARVLAESGVLVSLDAVRPSHAAGSCKLMSTRYQGIPWRLAPALPDARRGRAPGAGR